MPRMSDAKVKAAIKEMETAALNPAEWERWHGENSPISVFLEFPGGELTNPSITGFLWAWKMQRAIQPCMLEYGDRFSAHGLEGKIRVRTSLVTALIVWNELPEHRCQIIR